jgi:hypothetical protein
MQTQRLRNGVEERGVGHACRDDVANVDANEVPVPEYLLVLDAADLDKDEEDDGDKEEKGREEGPCLACTGCAFDLGFRELGDDCRSSIGGCSCGVVAAATKDGHGVVAMNPGFGLANPDW